MSAPLRITHSDVWSNWVFFVLCGIALKLVSLIPFLWWMCPVSADTMRLTSMGYLIGWYTCRSLVNQRIDATPVPPQVAPVHPRSVAGYAAYGDRR